MYNEDIHMYRSRVFNKEATGSKLSLKDWFQALGALALIYAFLVLWFLVF